MKIYKIKLGTEDHPDKLVWGVAKDGKYSVRSAYHLLQDKEKQLNVG